MAATVEIHEWNGAGPTKSASKTGGTIRFKHADDATVDLANPMVKPASGQFDRSFIKHLGLDCSVAPGSQITNGKFYVGAPASGQTIYALRSASYAQQAADATSGNDGTYAANPAVGSPVTFLDSVFTGTGKIGDYVRAYVKLADSIAAPGVLPGVTATFTYDEI